MNYHLITTIVIDGRIIHSSSRTRAIHFVYFGHSFIYLWATILQRSTVVTVAVGGRALTHIDEQLSHWIRFAQFESIDSTENRSIRSHRILVNSQRHPLARAAGKWNGRTTVFTHRFPSIVHTHNMQILNRRIAHDTIVYTSLVLSSHPPASILNCLFAAMRMCVHPFPGSSINMPYKLDDKFFGRNLKLALALACIFAVILHTNEQSRSTYKHANTEIENGQKLLGYSFSLASACKA